MSVKVGDLDRGCLFEQGLLFETGGNEASSTLVGVFLDQIANDGARLVEDEAIIVLVVDQCPHIEADVVQRTI